MSPHWVVVVKKLVMSKKVGEWCRIPYPGHPHGCPNYGEKFGCPPYTRSLEQWLDMTKAMWLIFSEFDLSAHVEEMRKRHPSWTDRQLHNVLYWQPQSRKQLRNRIKWFQERSGCWNTIPFFCPEGMGLNVYATMRLHGIPLQKIKNLKTCRHVALLGYVKGTIELSEEISGYVKNSQDLEKNLIPQKPVSICPTCGRLLSEKAE